MVTLNADRNLTEFAMCSASSGQVNIRELFRDSLGDPVTISLLNGKKLRMTHTLVVEVAWPTLGTAVTLNIEEYDASNALVATLPYDVVYGVTLGAADGVLTEAQYNQIAARGLTTWNPMEGHTQLRRITKALTFNRTNTLTVSNQNNAITPSADPDVDPNNLFGNLASPAIAWEAYVSGTYSRTRRGTCPAGSGNAAWYGFHIGPYESQSNADAYRNSLARSGFALVFDDPATYTKVDTDTLRVGTISTWARAAEGS